MLEDWRTLLQFSTGLTNPTLTVCTSNAESKLITSRRRLPAQTLPRLLAENHRISGIPRPFNLGTQYSFNGLPVGGSF